MGDMNVSATIDVGKNVQSLLEKLAEQIGTTVEQVWPWMVKAQVVEAYTGIALALAALVVGSILFSLGMRGGRRADNFDKPGVYLLELIPGGLMLVISVFAIFAGTTTWIQQINNPQYCALKELIGMVGK